MELDPNIPKGPFIGPNGKYITSSLFYDFNKGYERAAPTFSDFLLFSDQDKVVGDKLRYSMKKIYLELAYPGNDYDFAMFLFRDYENWRRVKISNLAGSEIKKWEDELEMKYQAIALKQMVTLAKEANSKNFPAYKYLLDKGYLGGRGRPSKEEKDKRLNELLSQDAELQEDMNLLRVIKGGKD